VAADEEADDLIAAAPDSRTLDRWVNRREQGEPLAWITGTIRFCDLLLAVDRGVYVPRPQSEELARRAARLLGRTGGRAVDLCTGAGPVARHLSDRVPSALVLGVDVDPRAVACARRNGVHAVCGDLGASLCPSAFDLVTAVAPYVPTAAIDLLPSDVRRYEPHLALDGGDDGLEILRRVVRSASRLLRPEGWLLLELGGVQDVSLTADLLACGFGPPTVWRDEEGDLRGLATQVAG
jgi:release factor glutamine methyltransferase